MAQSSNWIPVVLTLLVLPGMGHLYLKKRFRGYLFCGLALLIFLGAFARYFSVLFALVNKIGAHRPGLVSAIELTGSVFRLDARVMAGFLTAFLLIWLAAFLDLLLLLKEERKGRCP